MKFTRGEYLKGQKCPSEYENNLEDLLEKVNRFVEGFSAPRTCTSGFRTPEKNKEVGGAKNSAHLTCRAIDISDNDGKFTEYCLRNQGLMAEIGLWMEKPDKKARVHLQSRPAVTRVFYP